MRIWNRKDGGVEIVAQGEHEMLEKLLVWSKAGEGRAVVDNVEFKCREIGEYYEDFVILRFRKDLAANNNIETPTITDNP